MTSPTTQSNAESTPTPHATIRKILVPTDFSECSMKAFNYAKALADLHQAKIDVLHVISIHDEGAIYGPVYFPVFEKEFLEASETKLKELVESDSGNSDILETHTRSGSPLREIVDFATKENSDLIVISTHGHTGLKHLLLGSTAENVVRQAPCPVLVVREQGHDFIS